LRFVKIMMICIFNLEIKSQHIIGSVNNFV
jgi:hypothetical protein